MTVTATALDGMSIEVVNFHTDTSGHEGLAEILRSVADYIVEQTTAHPNQVVEDIQVKIDEDFVFGFQATLYLSEVVDR